MKTEAPTCGPSYAPQLGAGVMCPDRESDWRPFALWDDAQPEEPRRSGLPSGADEEV